MSRDNEGRGLNMEMRLKECQKLLAIRQKLEEAKKDSFSFQKDHGPSDPLFSNFQPPEVWVIRLLLF